MSTRYIVTTVTGYPMHEGRERTSYQVLDRAYCHALVFETFARKRAETIASELERGRIAEYRKGIRRTGGRA